jgi:hypothetical protein
MFPRHEVTVSYLVFSGAMIWGAFLLLLVGRLLF